MKIPLSILGIVALILAAFYWIAPRPDGSALQARTDLPWQITVQADGSSRVFDLDLGHATLADAIANEENNYRSVKLVRERNQALAEAGLKLKNQTLIKHMVEVLIEGTVKEGGLVAERLELPDPLHALRRARRRTAAPLRPVPIRPPSCMPAGSRRTSTRERVRA